MNFGFLGNIPWFGVNSNTEILTKVVSTSALLESPRQSASFDVRQWGWSVISIVPWAFNAKDKIKMPNIVNKELKRQAQQPPTRSFVDARVYSTPASGLMFPKFHGIQVQEHFFLNCFHGTGITVDPIGQVGRMEDLFFGTSDRSIGWTFCCYCHDMGYDSHDQAELLKADMAFLECLEASHEYKGRCPCCPSLQDNVYLRSQEYTYTIQKALGEATITASIY